MKLLSHTRKISLVAVVFTIFMLASCTPTTYVYQNGTTFNDYEVANNYKIKSATKQNKVEYSKAPNWKKISRQNRHQNYNWY